MQFKLKKPCAHCPFRNDIRPFLTTERAEEISNALLSDGVFPCHKTIDYDEDDEDGDWVNPATSEHCAGAMIILEKLEQPNQMMRIAERIGMYDRMKLDMNSPVFHDFDEFIEAQEDEC